MEDARKEFQIFMSPPRGERERKISPSKQRLVPVISKFFQPSASSFMLTQRKSSIYKAVSGVSFQETDSADKKRHKKKDNTESRKERKMSQNQASDSLLPPKKGHETQRSRSLTNMEQHSQLTDPNKADFTHPFAPVILYTGRQSRYTKSKDRRRAMSQNRAGLDRIYANNFLQEAPQPPRRTRSASRSSKSRSSTPTSAVNNSADGGNASSEDYKIYNNDTKAESVTDNDACCKTTLSDFSVNENDWKKYDAIVSEKLNTILRTKEEPEGGYFSLERDECDDPTEYVPDNSNGFQQDYYNESIYVSQVFDNKGNSIESKRSQSKNDYPEDEGLYEEIYFDNGDSQEASTSDSVQDQIYSKNSVAAGNSAPPRIEQGPTSTVVYITSDVNSNENTPSDAKNLNYNKTFELGRSASTHFGISNHKAWCNCCLGKGRLSSNFNHSASCIQNKVSNLNANLSLMTDVNFKRDSLPKEEESISNLPETNNFVKEENRKHSSPIKKNTSCVQIRKSKSTGHFEMDIELSDLDFDMFAPKLAYASNQPNNMTNAQNGYYSRKKPKSNSHRKEGTVRSPNSFIDVLTDSIFNPPDLETSVDDDDLIIHEDQIITCITDSSSDESEVASGSSSTSLWLEATNDFEYVAFKEEVPPQRRRKKGVSILPNFLNLSTSQKYGEESRNRNSNENLPIPERPTRRRKRSKSRKRNAS